MDATGNERTAVVLRLGEGRAYPMGSKWLDAPKGAFVLVPGGVTYIVEWFAEHPPGSAGG